MIAIVADCERADPTNSSLKSVMLSAKAPKRCENAPLAAPALVFFSVRYVAASPLSRADIMDCSASAN
ncbi:hypothetical protein D9M68_883850 [compost metagenome]|uniref:Uncharacterized protein n=1 Tax=Achromobacter agilis TaxID=1353888 RepID=A0A446D093_9BURK|nr:hypothetical protein AGI3411_05956 [Achromobacter agilis]